MQCKTKAPPKYVDNDDGRGRREGGEEAIARDKQPPIGTKRIGEGAPSS